MSYEVEFWAHELFINRFMIVKMSAEDDDVVKKATRTVEISTTSHTFK